METLTVVADVLSTYTLLRHTSTADPVFPRIIQPNASTTIIGTGDLAQRQKGCHRSAVGARDSAERACLQMYVPTAVAVAVSEGAQPPEEECYVGAVVLW